MDVSKYNQIAEKLKPQKQLKKHCISAFVYGGIIGIIGQGFLDFYMAIFDIKEKDQVDNPQLFSLIVVEDKGQLKIEESL